MKRLTKILMLLLVSALIATVFTVGVFASEETLDPASYKTKVLKGDWEGQEPGTFIGVDVSRYGYIFSARNEYGDDYGVWQIKGGSGNNFIEPFFYLGTRADGTVNEDGSPTGNIVHNYNASEYPYMVFDFDVMTPTGSYGTSAGFNFRFEHTKDSNKTNYVGYPVNFGINKISPYLSKALYNWQHVTAVMQFMPVIDEASGLTTEAYYHYYFYVNGVLATDYKSSNLKDMVGYLPEDIGFISLRINGDMIGVNTDQTALDNLAITFVKDGDASVDEIASVVYNDSYVLPYGRTVAQIGSVKYDKIYDAIDAAKEGETIKLCADVGAINVDKEVKFDRNNGEGGLYNLSVTHLKKFTSSEENGIFSVEKVRVHNKTVTGAWESLDAGVEFGKKDPSCYGYLFTGVSDNGENKFGIWEPRDGGNNNFWEPSLDASMENQGTGAVKDNNFIYNHKDFPYLAIDFDMMTPTGAYDTGITFPLRTHHTADGSSKYVGYSANNMTLGSFTNKLDSNPYTWHHITMIVTVDNSVEGEFRYVTYVYLNGETLLHTYVSDNFASTYSKYSLDDLGYTSVRINGTDEAAKGRQTAIDNLALNYFSADYGTVADMAGYVFGEGYEFPYGKTLATIGEKSYDDMQSAIDAAEKGDTIKLAVGLDGTFYIEKEISIDTNVYKDGVPTGERYVFDYYSHTLVPTEADGIVTFTYVEGASVTVKWGAEGDPLYKETTVMLNTLPIYPDFIAIPPVVEGDCTVFVGWTYTEGGKAEPLRKITEEDLLLGTVTVYPVYEDVHYDFEVIGADGAASYFMESDFRGVLEGMTQDAKFTLFSDITVERGILLPSGVVITLDLNGKSLILDMYAESTQEVTALEFDGENYKVTGYKTTNWGSKDSLFKFENSNSGLNIFSSVPGAKMFSACRVATNRYYKEIAASNPAYAHLADRVDYIGASAMGGVLARFYNDASFNIEGENLSFWGSVLAEIYENDVDITIDGGSYYRTVTDLGGIFNVRPGVTPKNVYAKNATFAAAYESDCIVYFYSTTTATGEGSIRFENCDLLRGRFSFQSGVTANTVYLDNCRYNGVIDSKYITVGLGTTALGFGENTVFEESDQQTVVYNNENTVTSTFATNSYKIVGKAEAFDPSSYVINENAQIKITFKVQYALYSEVSSTVYWEMPDGSENVETVIWNTTLTPPRVTFDTDANGWAVGVYTWINADGIADYTVAHGSGDLRFTAVKELDGESKYEAEIKNAMFNFIYYGQFHVVLYLPKTDVIADLSVDGFADGYTTVMIDGVPYFAFTAYCSTTGVSEDIPAKVNFTYNDQLCTQSFNLSALNYAKAILSDPINDTEAKAVANMVRYVKEARLAAGLEIGEKFSEVEALYALDDYKAAAEYDDLGIDYSTLIGYVQSINFMIEGSSASYVFTLTDEAAGAGAEISVTYRDDGRALTLCDSENLANSVYSTNTRVYDLVDAITVTVTIPAAEEGAEPTVVSGTYSIGAYINATDNDLAKAMCEFGNAAALYREYLINR